jgi:hypothetical protein
MDRRPHLRRVRREPASAGRERARKFVVAFENGVWRVRGPSASDAEAFPSREAATAFACALAKAAAAAGVVGMAVVKAELQELHCFTPAVGAAA